MQLRYLRAIFGMVLPKAWLTLCVFSVFPPGTTLGTGHCGTIRAVGASVALVAPEDADLGLGISMLLQTSCLQGPFRPELRFDHWQAALSSQSPYRELSYWAIGVRWRAPISGSDGIRYFSSLGVGLERVAHRAGSGVAPAWEHGWASSGITRADWGLNLGMGLGCEFEVDAGTFGAGSVEFVFGEEIHLRLSITFRFLVDN